MADRSLDPESRALWQRVTDTVRPLVGRKPRAFVAPVAKVAKPVPARASVAPPAAPPRLVKPVKAVAKADETLDGGWDRRLRRGVVAPDMTIDLHGHTLLGAHSALEAGLATALARHARVILLVTGRPPRDSAERMDGRPVRGAIRASVGDWLAGSRHAPAIAAVRSAHPRHGGAGALYVILRRRREPA